LTDPSAVVEDGQPYVLSQTTRRALALRGLEAEEVLYVEEFTHASLFDLLPGAPPDRAAVESAVRAIKDELHADVPLVRSVVGPFVGAPAQPGEGAGLSSTFGAVTVEPDVLRGAASTLESFLPPWMASRSRFWGGSARAGPVFVPYTVGVAQYRYASPALLTHPAGTDSSALLYGGAQPDTVLGMIFAGDVPALRTRNEIEALSLVRPRPEALVEAIDVLVRLHVLDPRMPPDSTFVVGLREARREVEESAVLLLEQAGVNTKAARRLIRAGPSISGSLLRGALCGARLGSRTALGQQDFLAAAKAFSDSVATYTLEASPSDLRRLTIAADLDLSKTERDRRIVMEAALRTTPGLTVDELWDQLAGKGLFDDRMDLERYIDRLQIAGEIIELLGGRYEWLS
jgi:hypothetical protein